MSIKKKHQTYEFTRLVNNLVSGELGFIHIQIAMRTYVRRSKDIPEEVKDLLAGKSVTYSGLIYHMFQTISEVIGAVELAFRRGNQAGLEDRRKR